MGCVASRLENEDCVRRCKERRRLMKEAVYSGHHLASAHSDYLHSLRLTGSALTRFALGEPLAVSEEAPLVFLPSYASSSIPTAAVGSTLPAPKPMPKPPSARSTPGPPPLHRPFHPHRFSQSPSPPASVASASPSFRKQSFATPSDAGQPRFPPWNTTSYAATPSQSSSAWEWEKCYPPSPPDSDFFDRKKAEIEARNRVQHHFPPEEEGEESDEGPSARDEEGRVGREEVYCSEWGEHCSSPASSSEPERRENREAERNTLSRTESMATRSGYPHSQAPPSELASSAAAEVKSRPRPASEAGSSSARWKNGIQEETISSSAAAVSELPVVVRHRNLAEIAAAIEELFVKASNSGSVISDLLEIGRAHFDGSFRQLKSKWKRTQGFKGLSTSRSVNLEIKLMLQLRIQTFHLLVFIDL